LFLVVEKKLTFGNISFLLLPGGNNLLRAHS
jgi:hypothetical protein